MGEGLEEFFDKVEKGETKRARRRSNDEECATPVPEPYADEEVSSHGKNSFTLDAEKRWASDNERFWACKTTYDVLPAGLYTGSLPITISRYSPD